MVETKENRCLVLDITYPDVRISIKNCCQIIENKECRNVASGSMCFRLYKYLIKKLVIRILSKRKWGGNIFSPVRRRKKKH